MRRGNLLEAPQAHGYFRGMTSQRSPASAAEPAAKVPRGSRRARRPDSEYDVVVVGGGPAGSTVATIVAQAGHQVALLERQVFPRYRLGESLWVATWKIFRFLGVADDIRAAGFVVKRGGTFIWGPIRDPWTIYFTEQDGSVSSSCHVERAAFDQLLLRRAESVGVRVFSNASALGLVYEGERVCGVRVSIGGNLQVVRSRFVVDATGLRSTLAPASMRGAPSTGPISIAVWSYFNQVHGLPPPDDGNVVTVMHPRGWFWGIPLRAGRMSVGAVLDPPPVRTSTSSRGTFPAQVFQQAVALCPILQRMLARATVAEEFRFTTYRPRNLATYHAPGFLAVGDAACFIDPVFSTGVHLGMSGACYAGFALNTILCGGHEAAALDTFERYYRSDHHEYQEMTEDIYALNASEPDPFWQARCPACPPERMRRQADTLRFLRRIAPLHGDLHAISQLQARHERRLRCRTTTGCYRWAAFLNARPVLGGTGLRRRRGYRLGGSATDAFEDVTLVLIPGRQEQEAFPPDLALFELADGHRTVRDLVAALRARFDLSAFDDRELAERIGWWVDAGVLKSADKA